MSLYRRTSNFALQLHERFAIKIPELNASPVIWKCVRSLGGSRKSFLHQNTAFEPSFRCNLSSPRFFSSTRLTHLPFPLPSSVFSYPLPCRHLSLPLDPTPSFSPSRSRSQSRSQPSKRSSGARRSNPSSKRGMGRRSCSPGAGNHGGRGDCPEDGVWAGWEREVSLSIILQSESRI